MPVIAKTGIMGEPRMDGEACLETGGASVIWRGDFLHEWRSYGFWDGSGGRNKMEDGKRRTKTADGTKQDGTKR